MVGKELGQYKVLAEIGRGGMGIVYKAYQISLNREVALKVLPPALSSDENLVKRFLREAESAAKLSHPNIVQIFDISEIEGIHFFAMEYLRGETLTRKIEREGALSIKEAVRIGIAVADALSYSHTEGIVHRDIKPGNIMIDPLGHVKVTDFGLARIMESSRLTMTGIIIGTPEYMSPEQARGENLDGRSDLYSLAIVLYEALTGKIPFEASTPFAVAQKQIYDPLPFPSSMRTEIPKDLESIILKCAEKDPKERYQSGEEFKKDLESFASGIGIERITPTVAVPPIKKGEARRGIFRRIRWGRVVLGIILFIVFLGFLRIKEQGLLKPEKKTEPIVKEEVLEPAPRAEEKVLEHVPPLTAEKPEPQKQELQKLQREQEEEAKKIAEEKRIKEARDREAGKKFREAQKLVDKGETVEALLEFNQIARDYPGTEWEARSNGKVEELEKALKEGEAKKEFLEAQDLLRKDKFIEATQLYQGIISKYPETTWAKKAEEEIAKLKEKQARLKEKVTDYKERPGDKERPQGRMFSFEKELEDTIRSDREIMHFMVDRDSEGLAQYFKEKYPDRVERWAKGVGMTSDEFLSELTQRMVEGMESEMAGPRRGPPRREGPQDFGPSLEEAQALAQGMKRGDPDIEKLVKKGDEKNLANYLWLNHKEDLNEIALAMGIREINMPFSHMVARYLMGNTRAFEAISRRMERGDFRRNDREMGSEDFRPPEDEFFVEFRESVQSDETLSQYIEKRDAEGLRLYLMSRYYEEIKEISEKLNRPFRDLARELSERLVYETDANFKN